MSGNTYFGYIQLNNDFFYIKDMHMQEVIKMLMSAKIGDVFNIHNLGVLQLSRKYIQDHLDVGAKITEIGLLCNRIDA